ncbi:HAAS signaling domain-containing protein [Cryptosporangium sp. NPDC051539]|uniref:HAAS signaling domain-containing protein n=1 Tax=Cryptosporangium sp. NPDC051539 TaxID=3363962 RepID=UPI0037BDDFD6
MTAPTVGTEADRYLQRVRAALADLPDEERNELLEDLSAHLADVSAETPGTLTQAALVERLGPPEAYAAELRSAAGLEPAPTVDNSPAGRLRGQLASARATLDALPAYRRFRAFLPELRPGWWVLRGFFFAAFVFAVFGSGFDGVLPGDGGEAMLFLIFVVAAAYASVWLGRRTDRFAPWIRAAVVAGGILLAIAGIAIVGSHNYSYETSYGYSPGPFDSTNDLRVYGPDGKLIRDAQVFDQNGNPIVVPETCSIQTRTRTDGGAAENVYPRVYPSRTDEYSGCTPDGAPLAEQLPGLAPVTPATPSGPAPSEPVPSESAGSASPGTTPSGSAPAGTPAASSAAPTPTGTPAAPPARTPAASPSR